MCTPYLDKSKPTFLQWFIQVAQLPQRDRATGRVSYGQKWKIGTAQCIWQ